LSNNAYQKVYQLKRYHHRRGEAISQLGGKCVTCQSSTDLQIDHIDPKQKTRPLAHAWSMSEDKWLAELAKCQLLCHSCHIAKTRTEQQKPITHGTYAGYRKGCRCEPCKVIERHRRKKWIAIRSEKRALLRVWKRYTVSMGP